MDQKTPNKTLPNQKFNYEPQSTNQTLWIHKWLSKNATKTAIQNIPIKKKDNDI